MEDDEDLDPEFERELEPQAASEPEAALQVADPNDGREIDSKAEQALAQLNSMFDDDWVSSYTYAQMVGFRT